MSEWLLSAIEVGQWLFLAYFLGLNLMYIGLNLVSLRVIGRDRLLFADDATRDYGAGLEPGISLIVPAYNEAATIVESVRSMLQLDYPDFEIVVVNDGSKDGTLDALREAFALVPFPEAYRVALPVQPVRGVWASPRQARLRVIDKDNGGKADALNAGINAARHELFCAVDADTVLQHDSLRRIARPFMEDARVVACGGTVRVSNGCTVEQGFLHRVGLPRSWLARVQIVEYLRAFLFGRLGWSPLNALLIISGAFGLFRRSRVIEAGGYRPSTIGEDMELVMRLHRQERLARRPYRIVFVPDPVCWTEVPEQLAVLRVQRERWQRGLLESLWLHRGMLFAPRSGLVGWVAYPAMLLFEAMGPLIEVCGYGFMALCFALGLISATAFWTFMLLVLGMGLMLSANALLLEELSFHLYPRWSHLSTLALSMLIENFGYRQLNTWWRLRGTWRWLGGRPAVWGEMRRKGSGP